MQQLHFWCMYISTKYLCQVQRLRSYNQIRSRAAEIGQNPRQIAEGCPEYDVIMNSPYSYMYAVMVTSPSFDIKIPPALAVGECSTGHIFLAIYIWVGKSFDSRILRI